MGREGNVLCLPVASYQASGRLVLAGGTGGPSLVADGEIWRLSVSRFHPELAGG